MNATLASAEKIGNRIATGMSRLEQDYKDIAKLVGLNVRTCGRYRAGAIPESFFDVLRLGLFLGYLPDALVLDEFAMPEAPVLNESDFNDLRACVDFVAELTFGFGESELRPAAMMRSALKGMVEKRREQRVKEGLPPFSSRSIQPGAALYDAAPGGSQGPHSISSTEMKVSEDAAAYAESLKKEKK